MPIWSARGPRPAKPFLSDRLGDFTTDRRVLLLSLMALLIGAAGAFLATGLLRLIAIITNLSFFGRISASEVSPADSRLGLFVLLIPVAGGLLVGLMARRAEKIRGHGIPEAIEAILIGGSRIEPKVALLKPLSSAVAIGTGGPFGAEGPIIMTGGAFGSLFAQLFNLSAAERKTLLVAGAAAGMSATFGTPVGAVLIAVELLLFEWKPRSFIPVALASSVAAAIRPLLLGNPPLFPVRAHPVLPWQGLAISLGVGLVAGIGSSLLTGLLYRFEDLFHKLPVHWAWWPAIGGAFIGIGGLINPRALGVGYDTIRDMLNGRLVGTALLSLLAVKAIIWALSLGSGTSGGVLAPLLILGGGLGALEARWIPLGSSGLWAMVSMAAMVGGTMRAPLTAVVFAFELTHDIAALLPMLLATTAAFAVTVLVMRRSILTEKVARRGHHVMREYGVDPLEAFRVADVMTADVASLPAEMPVAAAIRALAGEPEGSAWREPHQTYPVVDSDGVVVGVITRGDALEWTVRGPAPEGCLRDLTPGSPIVAYPDEPLSRVANRMAAEGVGRVPVVTRERGVLVGILSRADLLRARSERVAGEMQRQRLLRLNVRFGPSRGASPAPEDAGRRHPRRSDRKKRVERAGEDKGEG